MSDPQWTCPACQTVNTRQSPTCSVCGSLNQATSRVPVVSPTQHQAPNPNIAPALTVVEAPTAAPSWTAPSSESPRPTFPKKKYVLAGAVAALLVVAATIGAVVASRGSTDTEVRAVERSDETLPSTASQQSTSTQVPTPTQVAPVVSSLTSAAAPVTILAPALPPVTLPPSTVAPVTNPPPTAPPPSGDFTDPDHGVRLAIPSSFGVEKAWDGASARWNDGDVTISYEVEPNRTVNDAFDHEADLLNSLASVRYNPTGSSSRPLDGRYVVAGQTYDGPWIYERGKIRCGALVHYQFSWNGERFNQTAETVAAVFYSDDPALDAMGGVRATC